MNRTPLARRTQIINCLVEGNSIRSTERMTNTHRDTIMRLLVEVGAGCQKRQAALQAASGGTDPAHTARPGRLCLPAAFKPTGDFSA